MSDLGDKIRAARRIEVKVGKATFTGTRATMEQALTYNNRIGVITDAEICRRHIDGWSGVKASDIMDGAPNTEIDFDRDVFAEIIGEKIEWWSEISRVIVTDAISRLKEKQENKKK
jgi:hypothetical protein